MNLVEKYLARTIKILRFSSDFLFYMMVQSML